MNNYFLTYERVSEDVPKPFFASQEAAGLDVHAYEIVENTDTYVKYSTGLKFQIPRWYELQARARSSIYKTGLILANGMGTIDSDYTGVIYFTFYKISATEDSIYKPGDRIGQLVLKECEYWSVSEGKVLKVTERGGNGHGSTGI